MPDTAHLTAFLAAAVVLAAIPGPGMLYVLARTLAHGRSAGLRSTLGTAAGGLGHVIAAAVGLSALLMTSALAFSAVKYAGAAYSSGSGFEPWRGCESRPERCATAPNRLRRRAQAAPRRSARACSRSC